MDRSELSEALRRNLLSSGSLNVLLEGSGGDFEDSTGMLGGRGGPERGHHLYRSSEKFSKRGVPQETEYQ